ncbi:MAG: DUF6090 family protein [Gammaproteobacteria bacterium]|nr:DUF6090 family protein [Gammaproteobacteria bacterium]
MANNRLRRYAAYALGEVALVVLGILIALQINNANESRLERQRETRYLENLKVDLQLTINELDRYIETRSGRIASGTRIIEYFNGRPLEDLRDFSYHNVHVQTWQRYFQNINTYEELLNSGNFGIISNQAIKNGLMDLELLYEKMKGDEDHMRFDFEGYVYAPFFDAVDIEAMSENYAFELSDGRAGSEQPLSRRDVEVLLQDHRLKNGFTLVVYMMRALNARFVEMRTVAVEIVAQIDRELAVRIE